MRMVRVVVAERGVVVALGGARGAGRARALQHHSHLTPHHGMFADRTNL